LASVGTRSVAGVSAALAPLRSKRRGGLFWAVIASLALFFDARPADTSGVVTVDPTQTVGETVLDIGITHGEVSADPSGDPEAVANALSVLKATATLENQHIMGWGALNPEPSPGSYDWSSLDGRVALIRRSGGTPVLTLCCAPDWMKGGTPGRTDWSKLEVAPMPDHYDDFARLAAQVARRYPDVRYFQVWNELKGFFDPVENRWDAKAYTELYNQVYDAVKAVRPDALVGGPYMTMDSWAPADHRSNHAAISGAWGVLDQRSVDAVEYWLTHTHGADFMVVDGSTVTKRGQLLTDPFEATKKFSAVTRWLREQTDLPIWWAEFYVQPEDAPWDSKLQSATITTALMEIARSGASVALLWAPQASDAKHSSSLWSGTASPGGGQPTWLATSVKGWRAAFPPGTRLVKAVSTAPEVSAFASPDTVLLVNRAPISVTVAVGHRWVTLSGHDVQYVPLA
jgi:hypothetical protein